MASKSTRRPRPSRPASTVPETTQPAPAPREPTAFETQLFESKVRLETSILNARALTWSLRHALNECHCTDEAMGAAVVLTDCIADALAEEG
jgi:hypothetical protein